MNVHELDHKPHFNHGAGTQALVCFDNGYSASVIKTPFSYGGDKGLWEIAVIKNGEVCYSTPFTDGVLGFLTDDMAGAVLDRIAALPEAD